MSPDMNVALLLDDSRATGIVVRPVDHPIEVWSRVHHWLDKAFAREPTLVSAADMFGEITKGHMTLWVIEKHGRPVAAFITKIERGSKGRALVLVGIGGAGMKDWVESFDAAFTKFARLNNCKFTCVVGRKGWERVFGRLGWVSSATAMMKVL